MHSFSPHNRPGIVLSSGLIALLLATTITGGGATDARNRKSTSPSHKTAQKQAAQQRAGTAKTRFLLRRLNRAEYENTLRDLLQLPGLNVKEMLPDDGRAFGYDKCATGLEISPVQMAKYIEAADYALDQAIAPRMEAPQVYQKRLYPASQYDFSILLSNGDCVFLKDGKFDPLVPLITDKWHDHGKMHRDNLFKTPDSVGIFRHQDEAFGGRYSQFSPVHPGLYRIRLSVWAFWWDKGQVKPAPRCGAVGLYYGGRLLGHFDAPSLKPTEHEIITWLDPGEYLNLNAASLWPIRVSEIQGRNANYVGPGIASDWLEVEGPLTPQWPSASHKALFGDTPLVPMELLSPDIQKPRRMEARQTSRDGQNPPGPYKWATFIPTNPEETAQKLLSGFLPRAFRRPVKPEEIKRYLSVVTARLSQKASFEEAMRTAYRIALCSPDFLFLQPATQPDSTQASDYALASRLAYFLWNSTADSTLLALAQQSLLHNPATLDAQIERMLKDPKSERFVNDFLDQWLDLRLIDATSPDRTLYPEYSPYLRDAMRGEAPAFFREMLNKNLPASNIVDSDFLCLNQRLAEHYGIRGIEGTTFRRVSRPASSQRGGLITQAAVMKVTANGTTTSPVKRGAWMLRHILGQPPAPPPPNVPAIEPDVRGTTTIREQLVRHRASPFCAACHASIDPPGFALEGFDVIGGYRSRFRATTGKDMPDATKLYLSHLTPEATFPAYYHIPYRLGLPVDASGELSGGRKFSDVESFKRLLLADRAQSARNLVAQLATYATGVPPAPAEQPEIERILKQAAPSQYGVRTLIHALIRSPLFSNKQ